MKRFTALLTVVLLSFSMLSSTQAHASSIWVDLPGVGSNEWAALATSADGSKVVGALKGGDVYTSTDSGATWTDRSVLGSDQWNQISMSADGSKILAGGNGKFAVSADSGSTWSQTATYTQSVSMSSDGVKMARVSNGIVYISNDSGQSWARASQGSTFQVVTYSGDGNLLVAGTSDGHLYTLSGLTWTERAASSSMGVIVNGWTNIITNSTGSIIFASHWQDQTIGDLYKSTDSGVTWAKQVNFPGQQLNSGEITCDASCTKIYSNPYYVPDGAHSFGYRFGLFSSMDGGATWAKESVPDPQLERGLVIAMSSNGKRIYAASNTNSANRLLTYNADYVPSNNASFALYINGSLVSNGQTITLTTNSNTVTLGVITADPTHQTAQRFGTTNCGAPGNCYAPDVQLDNYTNNISGTDTISFSVTAEDRTTTLTKTVTIVQPFTHRTVLNYGYGSCCGTNITNSYQEITTGSSLPVLASRPNAHFIDWSDGSTSNPRTDVAGKDISIWPNIGLDAETGKVVRNYLGNQHGGVSGPGDCPGSCQQITPGQDASGVQAVPEEGYDFSRWSDGSTANPRTDTAVQSSADILAIFVPHLDIVPDSVTHAQSASIPDGVKIASLPATSALPATTINFGGTAPASVTVTPLASNPAAASATPFSISGTKIVDIQIPGTLNGTATVCLDGAPTDHLYHFKNGAWVELGSRSYVNGQVCGVTDSFSPFAAAAPALVAAPVAVPVPDPVQQSKITALSVATAIAGTATPIEITGSFVEKIRAIQINGVALAAGSWTQSATSVAFTMPGKSAGTYQIQLFNGSAPVLKVQNFTFTAPIVVVAPTPAPTAKPKVTYIRCAKPGHGTRVAYGVNPTCPAGYVKK